MASTILELKHVDHNSLLKAGVSQLMYHAGYRNVKVICKDGTLHHNRMTIGLIFPELKGESTAIIPDVTVQEITEEINKLFGVRDDMIDTKLSTSDATEESIVIINDDDKLSFIEVTDELFNSEDDFVMFEHGNDAREILKTDSEDYLSARCSEWLENGALKKHQKNQKKRSKSKRKSGKIETPGELNDGILHEEEEFIENISSISGRTMKKMNDNKCSVGCKFNAKIEAAPLKSEAALFKIKAAPLKKGRRLVGRCQKCSNCKIENCGQCHACLNMKQFGGTGSLKKACMSRPVCLEKKLKNDTFVKPQKAVVLKQIEDENIPIVEEVKGGVFTGEASNQSIEEKNISDD